MHRISIRYSKNNKPTLTMAKTKKNMTFSFQNQRMDGRPVPNRIANWVWDQEAINSVNRLNKIEELMKIQVLQNIIIRKIRGAQWWSNGNSRKTPREVGIKGTVVWSTEVTMIRTTSHHNITSNKDIKLPRGVDSFATGSWWSMAWKLSLSVLLKVMSPPLCPKLVIHFLTISFPNFPLRAQT